MKKNSHTLRKLMSRASSSQWFEDEDSEDEENWNETPAERSARISKKKAEKAKQEEDAKEEHLLITEICFELVHELFISEVFRIAAQRESARKAKADAAEFARSAALKRFSGGIAWNQTQNVRGGPLAIPWQKQDVPQPSNESDQFVAPNSIRTTRADTGLPFSRAHGGDWIETARTAVKILFEDGLTEPVRKPRRVYEKLEYVGGVKFKGFRESDKLGPSWRELAVGQEVTLATAAVERLARYGCDDRAGALQRQRRLGLSLARSVAACAGVVVDCAPDLEVTTSVTYAPATKTTNRLAFPGGSCWVRWYETKETAQHRTDSLETDPEANAPSAVRERAGFVAQQEWGALDRCRAAALLA